ncbi:MAG: proline dehydrogenase family protein [Acidobacteria bacterium]|nr:proline dehydrogenase family protein [Acidobacteriaceae bacterium]MBV9610731.1 proline dehydrogenase family protein [Acidobacteriota bacterium]
MMRAFFIWLSENRHIRSFAERSSAGQRMSARFVAGTTVTDVMHATKAMNDLGLSVSIDHLGENVTTAEEARQSAASYRELLQEISARGLNANVSLKLTHMGLDIDEKLAYDNVCGLVRLAAGMRNFVRVDMEGSPYTDRTLRLVHELHRAPGNENAVGAVIQSYLFRSEKDVEGLLAERIRIRLCKGAYQEPPEIAFQKKSDVDANYVKLMKMLLKSGVYHGIATHDPRMIQATKDFARAERIALDSFEFQMLYGIRRDLQQELVREGYRMRVYIPFGTEWYPYFMRRLAERPANVFFVAKNMLRR